LLLAGDIGGTKTHLAVYQWGGDPRRPLQEAVYASADFESLEAVVETFRAEKGLDRIDLACFGVAGPVVEGQASITNLPWLLAEKELASALGISEVRLLNDIVATAWSVPDLWPSDVHTLNEGQAAPHGTIGIIAPGTGLGEAFLTWDGMRHRPQPSEGGHADFAPTSPLQVGLLRNLQERFGHVSFERVCSGMGLPNIYDYLVAEDYAPEPAWLQEQLRDAADRTPVIVKAALDGERGCDLCRVTLDLFIEILAAEASNLALKVVATGGIYLAGGIPPRILPALEQPAFLTTFRHKGRLADLLDQMPIHVILNAETALLGAAACGLAMDSDNA
jgi:glucokinase